MAMRNNSLDHESNNKVQLSHLLLPEEHYSSENCIDASISLFKYHTCLGSLHASSPTGCIAAIPPQREVVTGTVIARKICFGGEWGTRYALGKAKEGRYGFEGAWTPKYAFGKYLEPKYVFDKGGSQILTPKILLVTLVTPYTNLHSQLNHKLKIMWPTNTSFVNLLNNNGVSKPVQSIDFVTNPSELQFPLPNGDRCEIDNEFGFDEPNSQFSEDSVSESLSDVGMILTIMLMKLRFSIMNFMNDIGDVGDNDVVDIQDRIHLDFWNEFENKIRLGMLFENKDQGAGFAAIAFSEGRLLLPDITYVVAFPPPIFNPNINRVAPFKFVLEI
ncbi:hypothetical protein LXL04_023364 [Taraxacum kok-saghyz]